MKKISNAILIMVSDKLRDFSASRVFSGVEEEESGVDTVCLSGCCPDRGKGPFKVFKLT